MFTFAKVMTLFVCANIFIKKFIILFAFNLYKQINLFTQHIFANKYINTPYYIYTVECPRCLVSSWCRWCPPWWLVSSWCRWRPRGVGGVLPGGCHPGALPGGWCPSWWLVSSLCPPWCLMPSWCLVPGAWWCSLVILGGWWCLLASSPAYSQPDTQTGTPRGSSARRAVSRPN